MFPQHNLKQSSHEQTSLTSLMAHVQSFEILSTNVFTYLTSSSITDKWFRPNWTIGILL
jgi:hypothetical protein